VVVKSPKCPECGADLTPVVSQPHVGPRARSSHRYACRAHGAFDVTLDGSLEPTHDNPLRPGDPTLEDDEFA
jgi:hypothetical protein